MALFDRLSGKNSESKTEEVKSDSPAVQMLSMADIIPNRYQPRTEFDDDAILELSKTIEEHGLLQPIVVREYETGKYEIIAGERRFRATKLLGSKEIKAIISNLTDDETASMALIENLQRENLNPIEEAVAYQELMKVNNLKQNELSQQLGKSQSYVANKLRLLKLNDEITTAIANNEITQRHGRALLVLDKDQQLEAFHKIIADNLNVKQTEDLINKMLTVKEEPKQPKRKNVVLTKNMQLSVNTIKKSVSMIKDTGMDIKTEENDSDDEYEIIIHIKK